MDELTCVPEVLQAHILAQKIGKFAHIQDQIRRELLQELEARRVLTAEQLDKTAVALAGEAAERLGELGIFKHDEIIKMQRNSLIDYHAAETFGDAEIEEIINLARKRRRAQTLKLALDKTHPKPEEVMSRLAAFCELPLGEKRIAPSELLGIRAALIEFFISGHLSFIGVAKHHITVRGIYDLMPQVIGPDDGGGRIGGKAAGMILAMAILNPVLEAPDPEVSSVVRSPRSYFIRSDIMDVFKEYNPDFLDTLVNHKYKDMEQINQEFEQVRQATMAADYPPEVRDKLRIMLEEIGQQPIIVRSSSYLEDNSGFAFSGKYISIFLGNQGHLEDRLVALETAMKEVYSSVFSPDVMAYRRERGLLDYNERMCLLVQEVVGRRHGKYFFPTAAGVAVSRNNYSWSPRIRRDDGLARLVMGLGTRAVDRVGSDYPRLVPLGQPLLRPENGVKQIFKYSQREVDVLNLETNQLETVSLKEILAEGIPHGMTSLLSIAKDGVLIPMMGNHRLDRERYCLTFEGLLKNPKFIKVMHKIMRKLEDTIGHPVEVEFAYQNGKIYILQCRAFSQFDEPDSVEIPENLPPEKILFVSKLGFTSAEVRDVEYIVYVDPKEYSELPSYDHRIKVARLVGFLNDQLKDKRFVMIGPGRWGSNNLDLGVKVGFAEIDHSLMLIEIDLTGSGVAPDASFGTHFFHDLVESKIIPLAVQTENGAVYNSQYFQQQTDIPSEWADEFKELERCVKLMHIPSLSNGQKLQVMIDGSKPLAMAFLQ